MPETNVQQVAVILQRDFRVSLSYFLNSNCLLRERAEDLKKTTLVVICRIRNKTFDCDLLHISFRHKTTI